jgi:hypothetical protein
MTLAVLQKLSRPCGNTRGLKVTNGLVGILVGIRHFPPKSAPDLA